MFWTGVKWTKHWLENQIKQKYNYKIKLQNNSNWILKWTNTIKYNYKIIHSLNIKIIINDRGLTLKVRVRRRSFGFEKKKEKIFKITPIEYY